MTGNYSQSKGDDLIFKFSHFYAFFAIFNLKTIQYPFKKRKRIGLDTITLLEVISERKTFLCRFTVWQEITDRARDIIYF